MNAHTLGIQAEEDDLLRYVFGDDGDLGEGERIEVYVEEVTVE